MTDAGWSVSHSLSYATKSADTGDGQPMVGLLLLATAPWHNRWSMSQHCPAQRQLGRSQLTMMPLDSPDGLYTAVPWQQRPNVTGNRRGAACIRCSRLHFC